MNMAHRWNDSSQMVASKCKVATYVYTWRTKVYLYHVATSMGISLHVSLRLNVLN